MRKREEKYAIQLHCVVDLGCVGPGGDVSRQDYSPIRRAAKSLARGIENGDSDIPTVGQSVLKLFAAYEMIHYGLGRQRGILASSVHLEYGD
jgi:hypothetical protein